MEASPEFIMLASVVYSSLDPDLPVTFSSKAIAFLKEKLGQDALIITDDLTQKSFSGNFPLKAVVAMPIKAGADILLSSDLRWSANAASVTTGIVQSGHIPEELINKAVLRIIQLKQGVCGNSCAKLVENTLNLRN